MKLEFQQLHADDIQSVSLLVNRAFTESVAPTLTNEGIINFASGVTPESIKERLLSGNTFVICKINNTIVGIGEVRNKNHLNLLFVEPGMQRKGIGRKLLMNLSDGVESNEITVNSSLNAVNIYKKLGFKESGTKDEINGIKYQPMIYIKKHNKSFKMDA